MYLLPSQPAVSVPMMLKSPMTAIATAPRLEVVVIPIPASIDPASMGEHSSVTKAGKCAVMKAS